MENNKKYISVVFDRMNSLDSHKTRWYSNYKDAYDAGWRLRNRLYGSKNERFAVSTMHRDEYTS